MRQKRNGCWVLFLFLWWGGIACAQSSSPPMIPLVQPTWSAIQPDAGTLMLCNGEANTVDPQAKLDISDVAVVAGGRFGSGLAFTPASSLRVTLPRVINRAPGFTVEAWVRAEKTTARTTLWSMRQGTTPLWTLLRRENGTLALLLGKQELLTTRQQLTTGQWHHIALTLRNESNTENALLGFYLDGIEVTHAYSARQFTLVGDEVVIGSTDKAALSGVYDDIQVSQVCRHIYARALQPWVDSAGCRPLRQGPPYFRNAGDCIYTQHFDDTQNTLSPGLHGQALLLAGRDHATTVTFPLTAPLDLTKPGMLDFWLQPLDWDNHCADAPDNALDKDIPLLQIVGINPQTREEKVLLSWGVDRTMDTYGELSDFRPGKWSQVILTWHDGIIRPYYDQTYVFPNSRRHAEVHLDALKDYPPAAIRVSSGRVTTQLDELSIYRTILPFPEFTRTYTRFQPAAPPLPPLSVIAKYQWYHAAISVQFCLNTAEYPRAARVTLRAFPKDKPAQTLGETTVAPVTQGAGTERITLATPEDGRYAVEVTVYDAAGKQLARSQADCTNEKPTWYKNTAGVLTTVPKPWTPLTVQGSRSTCWSSTFTVGDGGWLSSCVTRGQELLAGPLRLAAENAHGPVVFTCQTPPLTRAGEIGVNWQGNQTSAVADVDLKCALEFDGMIKHVLTLTPHGRASFTRMSLDIPLRNEVMTLWHSIALCSEGSGAGLLPAGENRVWDSATAYRQGGWNNVLAVGSFVPMLWVGNEERGICWFADNDKGWFPTNAAPAVELIRRGDVLTLRLNLITEPVSFDQPRTIVFGLIPTPTKPRPVDGRAWHHGGTQENPLVANLGGAFDPRLGAAMENFSVYPIRGWEWAEQCARACRDNHKSANIMYMSAYWIGRRLADWQQFNWEWEGSNGGRSFYTPSHVDYLASEFDKWFGRNILDGLYIDEVYPNYDATPEIGDAYLLPDGKIQPSTSIFQEREFFKRVYGCMVHYGKQPLITEHMTGTMVPPLVSFGTLFLDGEGNWIRKDGKDFMDSWSLDRLRAMDVGAGGGNVGLWLPMLDENTAAFRSDLAWRRSATRTMIATVLLHDLWFLFDRCDGSFLYQFTGPVLRSFDIAEPGLIFTGYWAPHPLAACADNNIKISTYHTAGKILLIISNFAHTAVTATINIALPQAGLQPAGVTIADLEKRYADGQGAALKIPFTPAVAPTWHAETSTITVPVDPRDYRLIVLERR